MRLPIVPAIVGLGGAAFLPWAVAANVEPAATVVVHNVEFRGRPPFKRSYERLPVSDVARLETGSATTVVRTVDFRGRPPFRRHVQRLELIDSAVLEFGGVVATPGKSRAGGPPLKRNR